MLKIHVEVIVFPAADGRIAHGIAFGIGLPVALLDLLLAQAVARQVMQHAFFNFLDQDRKSTRLNSSHVAISYAVFCLKKEKAPTRRERREPVPGGRGPPTGDA